MTDETDEAMRRWLSAPVLGSRSKPESGRVKWFNAQRGFGYIVHVASGKDVFVRRSAIAKRNPLKRYPSLEDGEQVDFVMNRGAKGWEASGVTGPAGASVKGSQHTPEQDGKKRRKMRRRATVAAFAPEEDASSLETPSLDTEAPSLSSVGSPPALDSMRLVSRKVSEEEDPGLVMSLKKEASLPDPHREAPARHLSLDTTPESSSEAASEQGSEGSSRRGRTLHGSLRIQRRKQPARPRLTRELSRVEVSSLLSTNKFTRRLLSTPNVVSMSYTDEVRNGEKTGKKVLQVGVVKKLKKHELKRPNIRLPKEVLLGKELAVPVQVVEEGELRLFGRYSGGAQLKVVHKKKTVYGTLGARVKEKNSYRVLSCAHVLTLFSEENIGTPIAVAHSSSDDEYTDLGWRVGGQAKVKRSVWRKRLVIRQDIAWADVERTDVSGNVLNIGRVSGRRKPGVGKRVKICGGYSGNSVTGNIANTNATTTYTHNSDKIEFKNLCYIEGNLGFQDGDSGSAVIDEESNALVGIFMGATNLRTYFSAVVL